MAPVEGNAVPLNCPSGLEYLTMIDQLIIKQKKEMLEAITAVMGAGFETSNKYKIKNVLGQVCDNPYCCMSSNVDSSDN